MSGPAGAMLKAGLSMKLGHFKQALNGYTHDTVNQGKKIVTGYAIGAGLYLAAGLFLIAALFVGAAALFRWIEMRYGANAAFGITGGCLVIMSLICVLAAVGAMHAPKANYPSLASRMRVAVRANPLRSKNQPDPASPSQGRAMAGHRDHVASARNTATAILRAPSAPSSQSAQTSQIGQRAGIAAAVGLIGWALARRYSQPGRPAQANRVRF